MTILKAGKLPVTLPSAFDKVLTVDLPDIIISLHSINTFISGRHLPCQARQIRLPKPAVYSLRSEGTHCLAGQS